MSGLLASLVTVAAAVQVQGATTCPTPDLVAARLAALLPTDISPSIQADEARLSEADGELVIALVRPDGLVLGTRRLPHAFSCDDLASATAVSVAAWESDVHPEFSASFLRARAPAAAEVSQRVAAPKRVQPPWKLSAGLALGFGGSVDVPVAAADLAVGGWLTSPEGRTSLRGELEGQSRQAVSLQEGRALWRRWSFGLGIERSVFKATDDLREGRLRWFALARLAWLDLQGEGFTLNHQDHVFDPGVSAGLRVRLARGRWSSWIELATSLWPIRHDLVAAGGNETRRLPALESFVRLGGGIGSGP
jgi:hypothetical protein